MNLLDLYHLHQPPPPRPPAMGENTGRYVKFNRGPQGHVGIEYENFGSGAKITGLTPGGPALNCGELAVGDILESVDNKSLASLSLDEIGQRLRGKPGSVITLYILKRTGAAVEGASGGRGVTVEQLIAIGVTDPEEQALILGTHREVPAYAPSSTQAPTPLVAVATPPAVAQPSTHAALPREQEGMSEGADERGGAVDPPPRPAANDWYRREAGGGGGAGAGGDQERTSAWARDEAQEVQAERAVARAAYTEALLLDEAQVIRAELDRQRERAMNAAELEAALSNLFNVVLKSGTASRQRLESILLVTTGSGGGLGADDLEDCVALFRLVSIGVCDAKEQADVLGTDSQKYSLWCSYLVNTLGG
jgi:hypothetical protein